MDTLFENSYIRDESFIKKMYRFIFFSTGRGIFTYIFSFIIILNGVAVIATEKYSFGIFYISLAILFLALYVLSYYRNVKYYLRRDMEMNNGGYSTVRIDVYNDYFHFATTSGTNVDISYMQIRKVWETKDLILLMSDSKLVYVLSKDNFTKGSATGFLEFLRSKGFKIK